MSDIAQYNIKIKTGFRQGRLSFFCVISFKSPLLLPLRFDEFLLVKVFGTDTAAKDAQSVLEMHSTSYLIWANSAAKKLLGGSFKGDAGYVSAEYLTARLFELCGYSGPALMQASSEAAAQLPVTLSSGIFADEKGTVYADGAPLELQSRLYDLRYMQYYEQTNFRY